MQRLWIPGPLPGLNEILDARMVQGIQRRGGKGTYSAMKRKWTEVIALQTMAQKLKGIETTRFTYLFYEAHNRRDPSNVFGGGIKLIEDALITAQLLDNDGRKHVHEIRPHVTTRKERPGVSVFFGTVTMDMEQALMLDGEADKVPLSKAVASANQMGES